MQAHPLPTSRKKGERRGLRPLPSCGCDANYGQGRSGKDSCVMLTGSPKRPRESEAVKVLHGIGKGLFSFGINRHQGVDSFWNALDFDLAYERFKRLEATLEEMKKELAHNQEQFKEVTEGRSKWKDPYNCEVASDQSFLKSELERLTWSVFGRTSRRSMRIPRSLRALLWRELTTFMTRQLGNFMPS
ncbi:UNVERIFIED_CONTAM: hypothetical protein Sradi_2658600 [Sesamum radiatum]|uniref:Uncharacterized protein n=1 Tax=Sesamum radiatum TaxID=300843 RepID=A0AAW2S7Y5_SESRA